VADHNDLAPKEGTAPELKRQPDHMLITVNVNERPVKLDDREQTGLRIKTAAIAQEVPIQLDFVLSIVRAHGKTSVVGDNDPLQVHPNEKFVAVADDDNS